MSDYPGKDQRELSKILKEKQESLRTFRFNLSGSKVRNVKEGRAIRKEIARILTEVSSLKAQVENKNA